MSAALAKHRAAIGPKHGIQTSQLTASFLNWAQGYLTGFSAAVIDIKHLNAYDVAATQPDDAAMWAWLDNYCSNNPSMKLSQAVGALVGKLLNR
jgi:hypothetical protein